MGSYGHELLSDYGKSPTRVIIAILTVIILFAIGFHYADYGIPDAFLNSCSSFFMIGLGAPGIDSFPIKAMVIVEGALGFVLMTYFIVVLCDGKKL